MRQIFLGNRLGLHIALGWEYRGQNVQQAPVVYIALEGIRLSSTCRAFKRHHGVDRRRSICSPRSTCRRITRAGRRSKRRLGDHLAGRVFIDTLNRSLVGSESKDEDMARYLAAAE